MVISRKVERMSAVRISDSGLVRKIEELDERLAHVERVLSPCESCRFHTEGECCLRAQQPMMEDE